MLNKIKKIVEDVFSSNGWLAENGYRVNEAQREYALSVLKSLTLDGKYNFIEAGTGVGKSFAYFLPLTLYSHFMKQRIFIVTHTVALQNNLLDETLPMVERCLNDAGISLPIIEQRIGMQHFVDPQRVALKLSEKEEVDTKLALDFLRWSQNTAEHGSGLIEEWVQEYGSLPFQLSANDICLTKYSIAQCNYAYTKQKKDSGLCDILITSHMMLCSSLTNGTLGEFRAGDVVLIDEAERVVDTTESVTKRHVRLSQLVKKLEKYYSLFTTKSCQLIDESRALITQMVDVFGDHQGMKGFEDAQILAQHRHSISELLVRVSKLKLKKAVKTTYAVFDVFEMVDSAEETLYQLEHFSNLLGMKTSDNYREKSYVIGLYKPTVILRKLSNLGVIFICTSATLKDRSTKISLQDTFYNFSDLLSVNPNKDVNVTTAIEPSNYGDVDYVLADKSAPLPFLKENELNQAWIKFVANVVKKACLEDKRILLLASSHREIRALERMFEGFAGVSFHTTGSLTTAFKEFKRSGQQCFVTASGWAGYSFRSQNKQFFTDVMITKIPYLPPNEMDVICKGYELSKNSLLDQRKSALAQKIVYKSALELTISKLMQGFGRLIRSPLDAGTIWVLDPRYPHCNSQERTYLINAIPIRFREKYRQHQVVNVVGDVVKANPPSLEKIVGFI
jgi:ATP-dependent DNA helicase DinG